MYTRSYNEQGDTLRVPEGYSGTALGDGVHNEIVENEAEKPGGEIKPEVKESVSAGLFSGLFGSPAVKGILSSLFGTAGLSMPTIGTEEIIIIATAAFLFFSGDGDKECALLLLLLLLIN